MNPTLRQCPEELEARIDPEEEQRLLQEWTDFGHGRSSGAIFAPAWRRRAPPAVNWPRVSVNATLEDLDLMALQQYGYCSDQLASGSGHLLNVRCNYGSSSIIPLL